MGAARLLLRAKVQALNRLHTCVQQFGAQTQGWLIELLLGIGPAVDCNVCVTELAGMIVLSLALRLSAGTGQAALQIGFSEHQIRMPQNLKTQAVSRVLLSGSGGALLLPPCMIQLQFWTKLPCCYRPACSCTSRPN